MNQLQTTLLVFGILAAQTAASQTQIIKWDPRGMARARGDGCSMADTQFIAAGNEISVIFSKLGVTLSGPSGPTHHRKICRLAIPAKIRRGYFVGKLTETLTYGFVRSDNTMGEVRVDSQFMGRKFSMARKISNGRQRPFASLRKKQLFADRQNCRRGRGRGAHRVVLKSKLSVCGERSSLNDEIIVQIDGMDIRYDAVSEPQPCRRTG